MFGKYFLSRSHKAIDKKTEIGLHQNLNFSFSKYNVKKMKGKRDTGENICNNLFVIKGFVSRQSQEFLTQH